MTNHDKNLATFLIVTVVITIIASAFLIFDIEQRSRASERASEAYMLEQDKKLFCHELCASKNMIAVDCGNVDDIFVIDKEHRKWKFNYEGKCKDPICD